METTISARTQQYIAQRPSYTSGAKVMPNDTVRHCATDRIGVVHRAKFDGRILMRWLDADGNPVGRRSSVKVDSLELIDRHESWKAVPA